MKKNITREYSNGEVTIVWKPDLCSHSGNCVRGLPEVFKPNEQPWINTEAASTMKLIDQVKQCPSGALGFYMNEQDVKAKDPETKDEQLIELMQNGPLLIHGDIQIKHPDGSETSKSKVTAFCRCGASENKPFCDGAHKRISWKD